MVKKYSAKFIAILGIVGLLFLSIIPIFTNIQAALITPLTDTMSNQTVSASATNNFSFNAISGVPASGTMTITFPSGFTNVSITNATSSMSGVTFAVSGNVITVTNGTTAISAGTIITISNIVATNPSSVSSTTTQYIITISDSGGDQASVGVVITASSTYGSGPSGDIYEQAITINSTNTNTLTNYQVQVTLNTSALITAGQMQADCADIRFTDSSGNLLPYWIESGCNTTTTQIWVNVPSIAASTNTTIYLYYGSTSAAPESNGHTTFNYFDQGNQINNWTTTGSAGQNTSIGDPAPSYYANSSNGDYMYKNIGLTPGEVITFNGDTSALGDFYFLTNSSGAGQMYRFGTGSGWFGFATTNSWTSWTAPSGTSPISANTWYKFQIIVTSSTSASLYYKSTAGDSPSINGTLVGTYTITDNGNYVGLIGDAASSSDITYWDNIIVRQYSSPEPTTTISTSVTNLTNNQLQLEVGVNPFITFAINSNSLNIGTLSPTAVSSASNVLTLSSNASNGSNISVLDANAGLYNTADSHKIISSTTTLASGSEGYGINAATTYSGLNIQYPYNGTGNSVGALSTSSSTLCSNTTTVNNAGITVDYLASISNITPSGPYADTVTFIATGNF